MEDTLNKIGKLIGPGEGRDAIHIAVAPVISVYDGYLNPASPLCFVPGSFEEVFFSFTSPVGIVDPYYRGTIIKGQRFWMFLYPATITSLRHVWTHSAFGAEQSAKDKAEAWLRSFIADHGDINLEEVIAKVLRGPYDWDKTALCFSSEISGDIPDEFWSHIETMTGRRQEWRPTHFRCAC